MWRGGGGSDGAGRCIIIESLAREERGRWIGGSFFPSNHARHFPVSVPIPIFWFLVLGRTRMSCCFLLFLPPSSAPLF